MQGRSYYGQFRQFPQYKDGDATRITFCECGDHFADIDNLVPALFYGTICRDCENNIKRTRPKPIPMSLSLRQYIKRVESGEENPFTAFSVKLADGTTYEQSVALTPAGNLRKAA